MSKVCSVEGCEGNATRRGWCDKHYRRWEKHGDPLGGGKTPTPHSDIEKFIEMVLKTDSDECIAWPFAQTTSRRGALVTNPETKKRTSASRYICERAHGAPPSPLHQAAHECGKGHLGCVNPKHLTWKTPKENSADMIKHGTAMRGAKNPMAKLTPQQVMQIRRNMRGLTLREIADQFHVTQAAIWFIKKGKNWKHLGESEAA